MEGSRHLVCRRPLLLSLLLQTRAESLPCVWTQKVPVSMTFWMNSWILWLWILCPKCKEAALLSRETVSFWMQWFFFCIKFPAEESGLGQISKAAMRHNAMTSPKYWQLTSISFSGYLPEGLLSQPSLKSAQTSCFLNRKKRAK